MELILLFFSDPMLSAKTAVDCAGGASWHCAHPFGPMLTAKTAVDCAGGASWQQLPNLIIPKRRAFCIHLVKAAIIALPFAGPDAVIGILQL